MGWLLGIIGGIIIEEIIRRSYIFIRKTVNRFKEIEKITFENKQRISELISLNSDMIRSMTDDVKRRSDLYTEFIIFKNEVKKKLGD